jgi:hypothetical protein
MIYTYTCKASIGQSNEACIPGISEATGSSNASMHICVCCPRHCTLLGSVLYWHGIDIICAQPLKSFLNYTYFKDNKQLLYIVKELYAPTRVVVETPMPHTRNNQSIYLSVAISLWGYHSCLALPDILLVCLVCMCVVSSLFSFDSSIGKNSSKL